MGRPKKAGYKRSWKNILLDKGYQLKFTLVMAGLSAVLMALLGWWVVAVAKDATQLAVNNVEGAPCTEKAPSAAAPTPDKAPVAADDVVPAPPPETAADKIDKADSTDKTESTDRAEPPVDSDRVSDTGKIEIKRKAPVVTIETSDMEITKKPEAPKPDPALALAAKERYQKCVDKQKSRIDELWGGFAMIKWVLVLVGLILIGGLVMYGLKMTHKVAGPLFKVSLYLKKVRDNKYDTVYNLRKGDQLTNFYDHFKAAHAKLTSMQTDDIELLTAVIEAADKHNLADKSPELKDKLDELKAILADKEKSIV